jgi:flagellar hook assembly protein FlgD
VAILVENREMLAGSHRLRWDGRDASGKKVVPGVYLLRIAAGSGTAVQRIVMLK